jgi:beta-glucosidase
VKRTGAWPASACIEKTEALLSRMTLAEKVGQMTQASRDAIAPGDVQKYALGSVLSGGGSAPGEGKPADWVRMIDGLHAEAIASRLGIPLIYGSDAVHGHGNVVGATIFPHNIGLGATRDPKLVQEIARATAIEMAGTGVDWTFAPVVAAGRDERWGRTYETYSEEPADAGLLGAAAVRGYQGVRLGAEPVSVVACAKHFAGDGATAFKTAKNALLDQGDTRLSDEDFRKIAIDPYRPAIAAGVGSVMLSYSSVNGLKMHAHKHLVTDVLKGELGFRGFVVTDWQAIEQLPGTPEEQVTQSVNAGVDMFMEPFKWKDFMARLTKVVESGQVPMARIDDAVRRIVTVKCEAGLFEKGRVDPKLTNAVGSHVHRDIAARAVADSLVLLKNDGDLLPLNKRARILVTGTGAESLERQAGGWTVGWQGAENRTFPGITIFEGIQARSCYPKRVTLSPTGEIDPADPPKVAVLVMSEPAYAEGRGDSDSLGLPASDLALLEMFSRRGLPTVVVLLSGRPLIIEPYLGMAQAWLAAWLPGSEAGAGIGATLIGQALPSGKLSHSWPRKVSDLPLNVGDAHYDPLFPYGHGLTFPPPYESGDVIIPCPHQ